MDKYTVQIWNMSADGKHYESKVENGKQDNCKVGGFSLKLVARKHQKDRSTQRQTEHGLESEPH